MFYIQLVQVYKEKLKDLKYVLLFFDNDI